MITFIFRNHYSTVFSIEKLFNALYAEFARVGLPVNRLQLPRVSKGMIDVVRNAWYVRTHRRHGVLHITGDVHYAALLCPLTTTIITVHDCVLMHRRTGVRGLLLRWLWFSLPLRLAKAIVVVSEQTKCELLEVVRLLPDKITVIPNFVDPAIVGLVKPFDFIRPRILHVGTTPNKNLSRVIAALRDIPCVLTIVGPLSPALLHELQGSGLRFQHFVAITDAAMLELYERTDVVSFPSLYEGFGMPILEGQAVGRAVLTSDREPMRSVAGAGAVLVDPESVAAISRGFERLLQDQPLREAVIEAGMENCKRFSLSVVAAQYEALYRSVSAIF